MALLENGKGSHLTKTMVEKLNDIGFKWKMNQWDTKFEMLLEFQDEHGHCAVPIKYSANPSLGKWVSNQRFHYKLRKEGKASPLTDDRIAKLTSVGFKW